MHFTLDVLRLWWDPEPPEAVEVVDVIDIFYNVNLESLIWHKFFRLFIKFLTFFVQEFSFQCRLLIFFIRKDMSRPDVGSQMFLGSSNFKDDLNVLYPSVFKLQQDRTNKLVSFSKNLWIFLATNWMFFYLYSISLFCNVVFMQYVKISAKLQLSRWSLEIKIIKQILIWFYSGKNDSYFIQT